jgi:hypothetical protein
VYAAFSHDADKSFGSSVRIDDTGAIGRVETELLEDGSAAVSWVEFVDRPSSESGESTPLVHDRHP